MKVKIEDRVLISLSEFYAISLALHETLDEETVVAKEERLVSALRLLSKYADALPLARTRSDWMKKGYHDYHVENFHFAYRVEMLNTGERVAVVYDVCHDLLFHA